MQPCNGRQSARVAVGMHRGPRRPHGLESAVPVRSRHVSVCAACGGDGGGGARVRAARSRVHDGGGRGATPPVAATALLCDRDSSHECAAWLCVLVAHSQAVVRRASYAATGVCGAVVQNLAVHRI